MSQALIASETAELSRQKKYSTLSKMQVNASNLSLSGAVLATSNTHGVGHLWDLSTRRIVAEFGKGDRCSGLAVRRINGSNNFLYHTRGGDGLVSIHNIERCINSKSTLGNKVNLSKDCESSHMITSFLTKSKTFCAAAPCRGDPNLILLPSEDETCCSVRDLRMNASKNSNLPFPNIHGAYGIDKTMESYGAHRKYGMITSLAMISSNSLPNPIVACGMESGDLFFHDLAANGHAEACSISDIKLGKDPILCLDVAPSSIKSSSPQSEHFSSMLSIAGCAGDADELNSLPNSDQGSISIVKTLIQTHETQITTDICKVYQMKSRLRKRLGTCQIGENSPGGKPGVGACRFRDDGKLFAVGGWDKRVRIFSRDSSKLIAILKGQSKSITALDWSQNAHQNGLLATGSDDGSTNLWRVLPSYSNS